MQRRKRAQALRAIGTLGPALVAALTLGCERTPASDPAREMAPEPARAPVAPVIAPPLKSAAAPSAAPVVAVAAPAPASASTTEKSADGELTIAGQDGFAIHTHGGDAARLGRVTVTVKNDSARVRRLTVKQVEFLTGHDCKAPPTKVTSRPKLERVVDEGDHDERPASLKFALPPKSETKLRVSFASVEAYTTHCDRFAFRVSFDVDGSETLAPVAEVRVEREEPDPG